MRRAALLLLLVLAGCSVVNDPDRHRQHGTVDADVPRLEPTQACAEFASVLCGAYENCCTTGTETRAQCEARTLTNCRRSVETYLLDPRTAYDSARGAQLVVEARELASRCDPAVVEFFTYDLLTAFQGTNPRGDICITLAQAGAGDFAGLFSCQRSEDLVCRAVGGPLGDWSCQGSSAEGGACNHIIHCERGLYCMGGSLFANGRCRPQLRNGTACMAGGDCLSLNCVMGTCQPADASIYCTDLFPAADMRM
jgi:hypothetical protein